MSLGSYCFLNDDYMKDLFIFMWQFNNLKKREIKRGIILGVYHLSAFRWAELGQL